MEYLIQLLFEKILNQPFFGLIVLILYIVYHEKVTKWQGVILKGVEKYLIRFEDDDNSAKKKRIQEIVDCVKIKVTIIIMGLEKYLHTKANEEKTEELISSEMLDIASREMSKTWSEMQMKGYHTEVVTMKELSELLMPFYSKEIEAIAGVYKTPALNGSRMSVVDKMLVAFENTVVNTWERKFRMMCSVN